MLFIFLFVILLLSSFSSDLLYFSHSRNLRKDNLSVGNPTLNNYNNNNNNNTLDDLVSCAGCHRADTGSTGT